MFLLHSRNAVRKRKCILLNLWLPAMTICSTALGLGTYIFIARTLGPQAFGTYAFVQWLAAIAIPIIGVGTSTLSHLSIADIQSRESPRLAAGVFYFLWYRQCYSSLLYCLIYLLLAYPLYWFFGISHPLHLLLAGLSMLPLLLSSIVGIALRSLRRTDLLATLHLCATLSTLFFALIATQISKERIGMFLLASALAGTLTLILAIIYVMRLLPIREAQRPGIFLKERLLRHLNCHPLLFLCDAIVWQRWELLLLAWWRPPEELSFYSISSLISSSIMQIAPMLFSQWLQPFLLRRLPDRPYDVFVKTSCYIALLATPICGLVLASCPTLIFYSFGVDYLPLALPLQILLISAIFGSVAAVSLTYLAVHQQQSSQLRLGCGAALLNVILAPPLVSQYGMIGAALASALAQIVSAVGSILLCAQVLKRHEEYLQSMRMSIPLRSADPKGRGESLIAERKMGQARYESLVGARNKETYMRPSS